MDLSEHVCAVVVTYNRKETLIGSLDALLGQTRPVDTILLIDNASTDGTDELLRAKGYLSHSSLKHVVLSKNGGGALGFHEGFRRALELGADWVWAMDDDGLPEADALSQLLSRPEAGDFRGPLVLAREEIGNPNTDQLAFGGAIETVNGTVGFRRRCELAALAENGIVQDYACVFNGVLISRSAVQKIGLPDKNFFIWGDEWDYVFRARRAGVRMTTVLDAVYWHPMDRTKRTSIRFAGSNYEVSYADTPARNYLLIRNHAYLAARYRGFVAWLRHTFKYLIYHSSSAGCFSPLQVIRYSWHGFAGHFDAAETVTAARRAR